MTDLDTMQKANDERLLALLKAAGLKSLRDLMQDAIEIHANNKPKVDSIRQLAMRTLLDVGQTRIARSGDRVVAHIHGEFTVKRLEEIIDELRGHKIAATAERENGG